MRAKRVGPALLLVLGLPSSALAQPVGSEFRVNTTTADRQASAAVARRSDGSFVVVWQSSYQDGSDYGVFGQRFSSAGTKLGGEFQVNNLTGGRQWSPEVSIAPDGGFVVAWGSTALVNSFDVAARRFDSSGASIGGEFRVNSYVTGRQGYPAVAHDSSGNFIVVWRDTPDVEGRNGLFGQRFDSAGTALGGEFMAFENAPNFGLTADIAIAPTGDFVVVGDGYNDPGPYGSSLGVAARRFDSSGAALGDPFIVSNTVVFTQQAPSLAMNSSGDFVVAWMSEVAGGGQDIFARRFQADGDPIGDEFPVNVSTTGAQSGPAVASDADGTFLVSWTDATLDVTSDGVIARRFDAAGAPVGTQFRVNTYTTNAQARPSVASDGSGGFVVAWESYRQEGGYSNFGIYAQRYFFPPAPKDFGDAPDPAYPTLAASGGASHVVGALFLGATVDSDPDGQPDTTATGDDADEGDDEDGVSFAGSLQTGLPVGVTVTASQAGLLDAWVDWNQDGDWNDLDEQIFASEPLAGDSNALSITAPAGAPIGASFARFRLSSAGGLAPGGPASDGEIEDYAVTTVPGVPELSIDDVSVSESAGVATFTVTLSPASASTVTVKYKTANGTATSGGDYTAKPLTTLTFVPGETSKPVIVNVANDAIDENDESFFLNLSVPANAVITDPQGAATINDDDASPSVSIADASVLETDLGTTTMTFTVTLAPASGRSVTVNYATADAGSASAPADYTAKSGTLTFNAGQTSKIINVTIKGDALDESDEIFSVNLPGATSATVLDAQAIGTIIDNDDLTGAPTISIGDATVAEGDAGTIDASFSVSLSSSWTQPITVHFATMNGTATAGAAADYLSKSGTLTFPASGALSQTVVVKVNGDVKNEATETFKVTLSNPTQTAIADGVGVGSIQDDDPLPALSIADGSVTEGDSGTQAMSFTVTLSPASGRAVTVAYATQGTGSAAAPADYTAKTGTLTFSAGQTSKTINVTIKGDLLVEGDETFRVDLGTVSNATIDGGQATGTILDNE